MYIHKKALYLCTGTVLDCVTYTQAKEAKNQQQQMVLYNNSQTVIGKIILGTCDISFQCTTFKHTLPGLHKSQAPGHLKFS